MRTSRNLRQRLLLLFGVCPILGGAVLLAGTTLTVADDSSLGTLPLKHVADVPLPGHTTRLDYESYDPKRRLLFIAHLGDDEVIVFDVVSSRVVARIGDVSSVHGVLVVPELSRVYASATGSDEIVAIDAQYDPATHHIFVNVQTRNELVEIDPTVDRVVGRFPLAGARLNHGLFIDARDHLAFIACEGNDKLLVFDMGSKRVVQSFDVGSDPDVLAFELPSSTLYVAGEAGVVSMFRVKGAEVKKIGEGWIGPNSHVVAVDPVTRRAYFPLKNVGGQPVLRVMEAR